MAGWRTYNRLLEKFDRYDEAEWWRRFGEDRRAQIGRLENRFRFEIRTIHPADVSAIGQKVTMRL
jgi:hypothetical protein